MKTDHRGYEIEFDESIEQWYCQEASIRDSSLKAVKAELDRRSRDARAAWKGKPGFVLSYGRDLKRCVLGLYAEDNGGMWVTIGGSRTKADKKCVFSDCETNRKLSDEIAAVHREKMDAVSKCDHKLAELVSKLLPLGASSSE